MRIAKQTEDRMVIKGDTRRIKRNIIYGAIIAAVFIVPIIIFAFTESLNITNITDIIKGLVFPVVVLVGVSAVLYRESTRVVIDKAKDRLSVKLPLNRIISGAYPLKAVSEVRLRHHGNPYYFPKLSILLNNDEEIILSSDVMISMLKPGYLFKAPPLYGHVIREQQLAMDIAIFMGVPFREIKGGEVTFGLDQADKDATCSEEAEEKEGKVDDQEG
jgi:hypothetical protein